MLNKNVISFHDYRTTWETLQGMIENYQEDFLTEMYIPIGILQAAQHQIQLMCDQQHPGIYERFKPWASTQS